MGNQQHQRQYHQQSQREQPRYAANESQRLVNGSNSVPTSTRPSFKPNVDVPASEAWALWSLVMMRMSLRKLDENVGKGMQDISFLPRTTSCPLVVISLRLQLETL